MPEQNLIRASGLGRRYGRHSGPDQEWAVRDVDLAIDKGEMHAIIGPSGSGKSTLLHLLGGLDRPTTGAVMFEGRDLARLSERRRAQIRAHDFGFVFQRFNLVPTLTAVDNVLLPGRLNGAPAQGAWIDEITARLGLTRAVLARKPDQLSGGQQQRVALARALAARPQVLFADEPTGSLDSHAAGDTVTLLDEIVREFGTTVVIVTHDPTVAHTAGRRTTIRDGELV